jgi:hypothetical protein
MEYILGLKNIIKIKTNNLQSKGSADHTHVRSQTIKSSVYCTDLNIFIQGSAALCPVEIGHQANTKIIFYFLL